ncbi:MAG: sel1 repeat family protein [Candidatus Paracaedibacteraceae bacterium]|nr:sel1 repeat family protein [Candidatus Paracaedibacteraceae bacterium]
MHKKFLSYLLFGLSAHAFDKAEFLFEQKDYSGAVKGFLKDTQINDARVFPFLQHCQQNSLINPDNLDEQVRTAWFERLDHAQFAPTGYPGGDLFLQISLLAQDIDKNSAKIESLSRQYQTGYGFFVLARHKENSLPSKPSNGKIKAIITGYKNAAGYADPYSILALSHFATTHKIKIDKSLLNEVQYLKAQGIESANAESGLPETTLSRLYRTGGKLIGTQLQFVQDSKRKIQWQFVAAQKGNVDIQVMWGMYASKMSTEFPTIPTTNAPQQYQWYYLAALAGSFDAQHKSGEAFSGNSDSLFTADIHRSTYWFMRALKSFEAIKPTDINYALYQQSHLRCLQMLGFIYDKGQKGVVVDESKALDYFKIAAELYEDPTTLYNAASMIDNGRGTQADPVTAKKYFERASNKGDQDASLVLAKRYINGQEGLYAKNQTLAYGYLKRAKDHPNAKYLLSRLLTHDYPGFDSFTISKDEKEANRLLREAIQADYINAKLYWIEKNFNQRQALSQDDKSYLIQLIITLADANNQAAIEKLCQLMIENFDSRFENCDEKIHDYLFLLAKQQSDFAYGNLGYAHEKGIWGFEQSFDKAIEYYRLIPDNYGAQANLGFCLEQAYGSTAAEEIVDLYKKSLAAGNAIAANNLGALYQNGIIVEKDDILAEMYYKQGAKMGDADATAQYIVYSRSKPITDEEFNDLIRLIPQLDSTDPYHQYITAILLIGTGSRDDALTMLISSATSGIVQAQYTLGLYLYMLSSNSKSDTKITMRAEAFAFLQAAEDAGFELAKSANRILHRNIPLNNIQKEIAKKLLSGKTEEARQILQNARQAQEDETEYLQDDQPKEKTSSSNAEQRLTRDLEEFLDPQNNITFKDFQKIVQHMGGSITNGKGSGVHISLNGQKTGVHRMHRSGQSSNVNLEPGRASSLREFIRQAINQQPNNIN